MKREVKKKLKIRNREIGDRKIRNREIGDRKIRNREIGDSKICNKEICDKKICYSGKENVLRQDSPLYKSEVLGKLRRYRIDRRWDEETGRSNG